MRAECPADNELSHFVLGDLLPDESTAISTHVRTCARCGSLVEVLEAKLPGTKVVLSDLRRDDVPNAPLDPEFHAAVERLIADPPLVRTPAVGDQIDDYRLLELLGEGGMGVVFRAIHTRLEKEVAIKVIRRSRVLDSQAADRFRREMRAAGKVRHTNLVAATDAGVAGDVQYLVMEYVPGTNLSRLIHAGGPLKTDHACDLIRQAAMGLHHAHEYGLVHRDVKPSNLLLGLDGVVRVLDLGLALLPDETEFTLTSGHAETVITPGDTLTSPGQQLGTQGYTAPEQIVDSHRVDRRADVYGLGCTLVYLLAGHQYIPGDAFPPQLPEELWTRLLARNPDDRFPTALAAAEALAAVCAPPAPPKRPRRGWITPVAITATIAVALGMGVLLLNKPTPNIEPNPDNQPRLEPDAVALEPVPQPREIPPRGVLPMTNDEALALQKQWAEHIGQPVSVKNSLGMELVLIPPAEFGMSATYRVTLTKPYRIGTLEVTYAQFSQFVAANSAFKTNAELKPGSSMFVSIRPLSEFPHPKGRPVNWRAPGWGKYEAEQPIVHVTREDIDTFLKWLAARDGRRYRLPTHAEWVWACRAGSATRYYWGTDATKLPQYAWTRMSEVDRPQRVGTLLPNIWGLFDTLGNVSEMVEDYYVFPLPTGHAVNPSGPATGEEYVVCGGNYNGLADFALDSPPGAVVRGPRVGSSMFGFRVVLEP